MKVAILGTGDVGKALGRGFLSRGHEVRMGSRDARNEKALAWAKQGGGKASVGTFEEAARFGELAVLATNWMGTENALKLAGARNLAGKVVMDATNPLDFSSGKPRLAVNGNDSAGERVQKWAPEAKVVKVYNTVANALMVDPELPGGPPDMFIAGNDEAAKKKVEQIVRDFGWNVIDLGGIEQSRLLEPLAMVYIVHALKTGNWSIAWKLLRA
ncbi:MAG TPA: NAD(P)-binding domain-containing protein [Myxococcales bacterium]|nr:NAD(P)-binding domain-containing protein [Myxococcales bacterium]